MKRKTSVSADEKHKFCPRPKDQQCFQRTVRSHQRERKKEERGGRAAPKNTKRLDSKESRRKNLKNIVPRSSAHVNGGASRMDGGTQQNRRLAPSGRGSRDELRPTQVPGYLPVEHAGTSRQNRRARRESAGGYRRPQQAGRAHVAKRGGDRPGPGKARE